MISDEIIKDKFVTDMLRKGTNKVFDLQSQVAHELLHERTGQLFANLNERKFGVAGTGLKYQVTVRILKYLRFNEIRSNWGLRGKLHLYNRIVWGVLWGETLPAIKFGMTDEIKAALRQQLAEAGQQLELPFEL